MMDSSVYKYLEKCLKQIPARYLQNKAAAGAGNPQQ